MAPIKPTGSDARAPRDKLFFTSSFPIIGHPRDARVSATRPNFSSRRGATRQSPRAIEFELTGGGTAPKAGRGKRLKAAERGGASPRGPRLAFLRANVRTYGFVKDLISFDVQERRRSAGFYEIFTAPLLPLRHERRRTTR